MDQIRRKHVELRKVLRGELTCSGVDHYTCLSRINRDTRFSRDKSPYRDHLWMLFRKAAEPREGSVFFWFEFGPERLWWGLATWDENRPLMDRFP